jgi:Fe-S-cluster containining protein
MPGMLGADDVITILEHAAAQDPTIGDNAEAFLSDHFVVSEGATVAWKAPDGNLEMFRIPTITPAQRPDGSCVFFDGGLCSIHAVSPVGCSLVDTHLPRAESDQIVKHALQEIAADLVSGGPYAAVMDFLLTEGRMATPTAERRAAFERLYAGARREPGKVPEKNPAAAQ